MHDGRNHSCSRGTWHAHKVAQATCWRHPVYVEARQAPRTAQSKRQAHYPRQIVNMARFRDVALSDGADAPSVGENCRRNSKANHVGQGIKLFAELRIGVGSPGNKAVESIKNNG